jgi:hypothetical protein
MKAALVSLLLTALAPTLGAAQQCRCTYGQSCWPSAEEQHNFSSTLSHPLITVHPIGYPCHLPHYNPSACQNVLANYQNGIWRSDQPGASEYTNAEELDFGAQSCLPEGPLTSTCYQGNGKSYWYF